MGAELFRADGRIDMTKLIAFGSFVNSPKIILNSSEYREVFPNVSEACNVDVLPVNWA
jgi:hypothetical protein